MSRTRPLSVALLLLSAYAPGCAFTKLDDSSDVTAAQTGESAKQTLAVRLPTGASKVADTHIKTNQTGEKRFKLDASIPLPLGYQNFQVYAATTIGSTATFIVSHGVAKIEKEIPTERELAIAHIDAIHGPRTLGLGTDALPGVNLSFSQEYDHVDSWLSPSSDGVTALPLASGDYTVAYGIGNADGARIMVDSGHYSVVTLRSTRGRRVTRLHAPKRLFPDGACGSDAPTQGWTVTLKRNTSSIYGDKIESQLVTLADAEQLDVGALGFNGSYRIKFPLWDDGYRYGETDLPAGKDSMDPTDFAVGRIDIDDVIVNGHLVRGTYAIYSGNENGRVGPNSLPLLACSLSTHTGLDAPAGYLFWVETTYQDADGKTQTVGKIVKT